MSVAVESAAVAPPDKAQSPADPKKILIGAVSMIVVGWFVGNGFLALAYYPQWFAMGVPVLDKIVQALLAMVLKTSDVADVVTTLMHKKKPTPRKDREP